MASLLRAKHGEGIMTKKVQTEFDKFKSYVKWCKKNGVAHFKIGDIEGLIDSAHLDMPKREDFKEMDDTNYEDKADTDLAEIDDELLFHSA